MSEQLISAVALAIYGAWARVADPKDAERRFNRLRPAIRAQFEAEAKAAIHTVKAFK